MAHPAIHPHSRASSGNGSNSSNNNEIFHHHQDIRTLSSAPVASPSSYTWIPSRHSYGPAMTPPTRSRQLQLSTVVASSGGYHSNEDSSFSSTASTASSSSMHTRHRQQRRLLNRLAVYLPKPLRSILSSPSRLLATLIVACLFFILSFSILSSHPDSLLIPSVVSSASLLPLSYFNRSPRGFNVLDQPPKPHPSSLKHLEELRRGNADAVAVVKAQPVKRDAQVVLADIAGDELQPEDVMSPRNIKKSSSSDAASSKCDTCGKRGCNPEGYTRGIDVFKHHEPTPHFRDNLRKDMRYMTFGMMNGFTSQFLALVNGIYLAKLSDRVPILPPFAPLAHSDRKEAGYLSFSKIYDITYLENMLRYPIQDWHNLKTTAEQTSSLVELSKNPQFKDEKLRSKALANVKKEKLSCWSLWAAQMPNPGKPAGSAVQNHLGLDIEYWQIPLSFSKPPHDRHVRYWDLVMLDKDINSIRSDHLLKVAESKRSDLNAKLPPAPDDHLVCYDTLYYTAATGPQEWWQPHAPVWKAVGRYAHFNEDVSNLADKYIRLVLDIGNKARMPDFISVHINRAAPKRQCKDTEGCLPELEGYKRAVNRVRESAIESKGIYIRWVVVTIDEKDEQYLKAIEAMGWAVVDHEMMQTKELHGLWWETVLDAAIHSKGSAFVGTEKSTMSLIGGRRVEEWNKGPWELVKWGHKGAAL